jgi:hypothetical protein
VTTAPPATPPNALTQIAVVPPETLNRKITNRRGTYQPVDIKRGEAMIRRQERHDTKTPKPTEATHKQSQL